MSKQCVECGSISNDDAPRCFDCGGSSWRMPDRDLSLWLRLISAAVVIILLAVLGWVIWRR